MSDEKTKLMKAAQRAQRITVEKANLKESVSLEPRTPPEELEEEEAEAEDEDQPLPATTPPA